MSLSDKNLWGRDKVEEAIYILEKYEPEEGYYGAFSGGADSQDCYHLSKEANLKHDVDWHYCTSPIDPPPIYPFIRENYPDVQWDYHARGWWDLVVKNDLPTRQHRWCCKYIKEAGGIGKTVILGSRSAESNKRSLQPYYEKHRKLEKWFVRPILHFDNNDKFDYLKSRGIKWCELYDMGLTRIGCVLCPFTRNTQQQIEMFPKIANNWLSACGRILEKWDAKGKEHDFKDKQELFDWWVSRK